MQSDEAPCNATGRVEFSASITSCLRDQRDEASPVLGGVFPESKLAWISKGPVFEIVSIIDGAKVAAWNFGAVVRDFKTKVTCVTELPHLTTSGTPGPVGQVLVGLECELTGGMICLFNLAGSRVLRAINTPSKVTALNIVALGGEPIVAFNECFQSMSGIAAIGTNDGQILLIDLRRNDCDEAFRLGPSNNWEGIRDELQSCGLIPLKSNNRNLVEEYPEDHIFLHLNEKYFLKHQRLFVQLPPRDGNGFLPENPAVTSLLYVPQLASLCVGFAFGSFQIWSLKSLSLIYVLPFNEPNPIVQLAFQEACDDPNAYCYLWTVRGGLDVNASNDLDHPIQVFGPPSATMFSLCYEEKVWIANYGHLYKNFMMCSTGFEYDLGKGKETVGGRLISLNSVSRGMQGFGAVQTPSDDGSALGPSCNGISLCLIVWETWGPTGPSSSVNPVNTHMSLFDINQWQVLQVFLARVLQYVDQMPSHLSQRGGTSRNKAVASYLVSYDLGKVINSSGGTLLDVQVSPSSLLQFSSVQNVEEFSRPSSLTFGSEVLMERQVVHLKHTGVQRALLADIVSTGPGALMTPTNLYHECLVLGLRPLLMDTSSSINAPIDEQRTFLLCVALEQRLSRFVYRCAREWADGRLSAAGCTLGWLLSAAWNRAAILKQMAIRICAQLFDHSGEKLDNIAQRQLQHIVGIFHLLETLFESVVHNKWHLALNEWPQINLQNDALKLECQYYDVLQWLINVELLPEGLNPVVPYPSQDIANFYHARREELRRLAQQQGDENSKEEDLLLIDSLLKYQPGGLNVFAEWERDAGGTAGPDSGQYPPASLQALLRTFLVKDVALDVKHSVVIYILMDLASILDNEQYRDTLQKFTKFPAAFNMSVGTMRLTQAFWHLDHKEFHTALDMLLDPLVSVRDIIPWQHRCIIRLLTLQGQANMALRYVRARRPPLQEQADIKLHLDLLIVNDLINEAFMYQRSHRSDFNSEVLLKQFFQGCEERNHLRTVLQFSLDEDEEIAFTKYLETSKHPAADDLRVLYLLKRSRYVEALDVNQDLRKKGRSGGTRDVVVNGFYKTLPSVTRKLAAHCAQQQHKLKSWSQVEKPTPLFVNPKIVSPQMRYKSSLLEAAVEKSRETWAKLVDRIPSSISNVEATPFLCTPRTKASSHLKSVSAPTQMTETKLGDRKGDRKRLREEEDECMDAGNVKRSRFQKLESVLAELQQQQVKEQQKSIQRYSTYSCTDTLSLLNTPVVQRRSPSTRAKLQQQLIACSPGHKATTPQSIIKVRQSSGSSKSESPRRVFTKDSVTEPDLTEEESDQEPLPCRHTMKGESETDSELGDNGEDESPVGVTARRIIDFDSDISSDLSQSQNSFESPSTPSLPSALKQPSDKILSRIVVLSEARKAGRPTVTFGKGSVCVYDQDEPVDAEVAVLDESSNDTVQSKEENIPEYQNIEDVVDENSQQSAAEQSVETQADPEANFDFDRSLHLDTSSMYLINTSEVQSEISRTEESEVYHSAESSALGTSYSPNFSKNLARPSLKELTRQVSGLKRTQHDVNEGNSNDDSEDENPSQISKSARLEGSSKLFPESCGRSTVETLACNSSGIEPSGSLTRPSIRNVPLISTGNIFDSNADSHFHSSDKSDNSEMFSAESVSYSNTSTNDGNETLSQHQVKDGSKEAGAKIEVTETFFTSTIRKECMEIVELDKSCEGEEEFEVMDGVVEEDEGAKIQGEEKEDAHEILVSEDSDSADEIHITDNSNIFRTSDIDNVDSSSECVSESSRSSSLQDTDADPQDSNGSESSNNGVTEVSNERTSFSEATVTDTIAESPCGSNKNVHLDEACLVDSDNLETVRSLISMSGSTENVNEVLVEGVVAPPVAGVNDGMVVVPVADVVEAMFVPPVSIEEMVVPPLADVEAMVVQSDHPLDRVVEETLVQSEPTVITQSENSVLLSSIADVDKTTAQSQLLPGVNRSRNVAEVEHDDMPKLRLDAAVSNENLCESPTEPEAETASETVQCCVESAELEIPQPSEAPRNQSNENLKEILGSPSGKSGRFRRSSVSSSKSETFDENLSARRVTRSQLKSQVFDESFGSVQGARASETLVESACGDSEDSVSSNNRRTSKVSVSSHDGQIESTKQARTRCSSVSSTSSEKGDAKSAMKARQKGSSTTSVGLLNVEDSSKVPDDKLSKIEEESLSDKTSETVKTDDGCDQKLTESEDHLPKLKSRGQRKRRSSEVSNASNEEDKGNSAQSNVSMNSSAMETYETSRRLTRHQRAMLAKSLEMNSAHTSFSRPVHHSEDDGDDHASDDDRMSYSSVRSSQRLRAKRQQEALDSPSSTASTVVNPALTPSMSRRRRQSSSDVSELNRDISPVSSVRRQRSHQPSGTPSSLRSTPTRRSARLSAVHSNARQSEDGDNQSIASLSPSSVTSGRRSVTQKTVRRLSLSSEAQSEQFAFASPQIEHSNLKENPDVDLTEAFEFSPPKTVATPSKLQATSSKSTPNKPTPSKAKGTEASGSTSKRTTRQSRATALQTIKEESSMKSVSLDETVTASPRRKPSRSSWFFIEPEEVEEKSEGNKVESGTRTRKTSSSSSKGSYLSAYPDQTRRSSSIRVPQVCESDDSIGGEEEVKSTRITRTSASSQKQRKNS
ncbi:Protein ELYS [Frankliniella fusca]|uniref:Protein ELYS n=1 Tax=Frankliniella fusca TaxID=407009 RepID=A0AAE1LQ39_9NEOP|nr:Protein ELYS [Frankliniella fusca]